MESWFTEEEAFALLRDLFPEGLGGADVRACSLKLIEDFAG